MEHTFTISLQGFKGLDRTYELGGATVLTGRNGSGKSACREGLVYALTGAVPAGKTLDAVAKYFTPRGGTVTVTDSKGNWIKRGISRDHEKHKNTEILECSDHEGDGETPDESRWYAEPLAIDVAELLTLSPVKLREFFLSLCGGGTPDAEKILAAIAVNYARNIAGPAANQDTLAKPEDLPDDIMALATEWTRDGGLWETLTAAMIDVEGKTTSKVMLDLGKDAKEERLAARRLALSAQAAIGELEAEAEGARATAHLLRDRRRAVETAQANLSELQERAARWQEANEAKDRAEKRFATARQAASNSAKAAEACPKTYEPPDEPDKDSQIPDLEDRLAVIATETADIDAFMADAAKEEEWLFDARQAITGLEKQVAEQDAHPIARADAVVAEIPDAAHPKMPELRVLVAKIAEGIHATRKTLMAHLLFQQGQLLEKEKGEEARHEQIEATVAKTKALIAERRTIQEELKNRKEEDASLAQAWRADVAEHNKAASDYTRAHERAKAAAEAMKQAEAEAQHTSQRVELANFTPTAVDMAEASFYQAKANLQTAEEAAGIVKAHEDAVIRAKTMKLSRDAWKHAESAIAAARERLVGETVAPLLEDINEVLAGASRPERAYLELENKRGKAIFELGWKTNGATVSAAALSGGQTALFCAALACAVVRRTNGKKLLLVEADPVDAENLNHLLTTLAPWSRHLDAVLVVTARQVRANDSWKVIELTNGKETAE